MKKIWCVSGRHYNETNNKTIYGKVNPKTQKLVKFKKEKCDICGRNK